MEIITRKEARDLGLKFYFTGKPCKYGHVDNRRTSNGMCLGCESKQEYKNKKKATAKKHYSENTEHRKLNIKLWQQNNKDKVSFYKSQWFENNRDYFKEYYLENKNDINQRNSEYKVNNKDIINACNALRRASKNDATPQWLDKEQLSEMRAIYKSCQEISKETGIQHHVDHIIPLVSSTVCGLHVPWNLQIITSEENLSKGNRYSQ